VKENKKDNRYTDDVVTAVKLSSVQFVRCERASKYSTARLVQSKAQR